MSAYICDEEVVQDAVQLLIEEGEIDEVDATTYGRRLWRLNIEAVEQLYTHRYKEDGDSWAEARKEAAVFEYTPRPVTRTELMAAFQELVYQMAEGDVYHSKTWKWLREIEKRITGEE